VPTNHSRAFYPARASHLGLTPGSSLEALRNGGQKKKTDAPGRRPSGHRFLSGFPSSSPAAQVSDFLALYRYRGAPGTVVADDSIGNLSSNLDGEFIPKPDLVM